MCYTELYDALRCAKCKAVIEFRQSRNHQCPEMQAQPYRSYCHEQNWAFEQTVSGGFAEFQPEAYCINCQPLHFREKLEVANMEELVKDTDNRMKIVESQSLYTSSNRPIVRPKMKTRDRVLFDKHRRAERENRSQKLAQATTKLRGLHDDHGSRKNSGKVTKPSRLGHKGTAISTKKKVVASNTKRLGLLEGLLSSIEHHKGESYSKKFDIVKFECEQVLEGRQPSSHELLSGHMEILNFKVTHCGQ